MRELLTVSKRMRPDRVIVGEVLGDEILVMLNAMMQGNDGVAVHDPRELLGRHRGEHLLLRRPGPRAAPAHRGHQHDRQRPGLPGLPRAGTAATASSAGWCTRCARSSATTSGR